MTAAMPDVRLHPMADPVTRRRVAIMMAALFALATMIVWLLGTPSGPYTRAELRNISGVPYAPPQIQRRIPPAAADSAQLQQKFDQLEDILRGGSTVQPTPAATR